jgi:hypothetical protein
MSKYKDLIVDGSVVPFAEQSRNNIKVSFSDEIINEYIPIWNKVQGAKGIKWLALIMAQKEGFEEGTRAHTHNNPGNIGNTDNGANKTFDTLQEGIEFQIKFLTNIAKGLNRNFLLNTTINLKPYYSAEIAKNQKTYQLDPYCPGYKFVYTGQLDQFIKIYATGPRQKNTYLSLIRSYFKNLGYSVTDKTTLKELLELK